MQPTVYDTVAGRVPRGRTAGRNHVSSRLRPDEVLFRKINAPTRYEETDYYFAHRKLPSDRALPSGDLLSAIHDYVSALFDRSQGKEASKTWRCMDETALIALGILLEETAKETLGETGDLALVEAAEDQAGHGQQEKKRLSKKDDTRFTKDE